MLKGFDEETQPLTEYEEEVLLPVILRGLRAKVGKDNAVTNRTIAMKLTVAGYEKLNGARVRKVINHIRTNDLLPALIATSTGYYIATSAEELKEYEESLLGRELAIKEVRLAIARQRRILYEDSTPEDGKVF